MYVTASDRYSVHIYDEIYSERLPEKNYQSELHTLIEYNIVTVSYLLSVLAKSNRTVVSSIEG